jgi:hypothetical protein
MDAKMIDLNKSDPFRSFTQAEVGGGWYIYKISLQPLLSELDALISVAKMECHYNAGVTLSMKNLVGLAPMDYYLRPGTRGSRTMPGKIQGRPAPAQGDPGPQPRPSHPVRAHRWDQDLRGGEGPDQ